MPFTYWRKLKKWKSKAGEIRGYYEETGERYKFAFYPADGGPKQIKIVKCDEEGRFEVPSLNQFMSIRMGRPQVDRGEDLSN